MRLVLSKFQSSRSHGSWLAALVMMFCADPVFAFRGGPPAAVDGSPGALSASCRGCHGSAEGPGFVQVLNFPAQYQANVTYSLIVRITDASRAGAGFQASVQTTSGAPAGTIIQTDFSNTQLTSRLSPTVWRGVQHTGTGVNNAVSNWVTMGNAAEYAFDWTAPASDMGPLTAWAAGNAINNNFSSSGDFIYLTTATASFQPPVVGACCDEALGLCSDDQLQSDCENGGGRYGGDYSTCTFMDPSCIETLGACCAPNDTCQTVTWSACVAIPPLDWTRVWQPNVECGVSGQACLISGCLDRTGACAVPHPSPGCEDPYCCSRVCSRDPFCCEIEWDFACMESGLLLCAGSKGACCDVRVGGCIENEEQLSCAARGGRFGGAGSTCQTLDPACQAVLGACCDPIAGACVDGVELTQCQTGRWGGPDSTCATIDPACTALPGACCDDLSGECTDGVISDDCPTRWGGLGSTCSTIDPVCVPTIGACCDGTDGSCTDGQTSAACTGDQLTLTLGTACSELNPPCSEHTGACCDGLSGGCTDDVPGSACTGSYANWSKGAACADLDCDAATGACCDHDAFGVCQEGVTLAQCECSTCEWRKGGTCCSASVGNGVFRRAG